MPPPPTDPTPDAFDAWLDALFSAPPSPPDGIDNAPEAAARELRILAAQTDAIALPSASWKEILMSSQTATTASAPSSSPASARLTPARMRWTTTLNRIVSIAAILAIVLAGVATAWVSRDRLGFGDGDQQPTLQLAASPASTVTCTTRTLSQEEADRIVAAYRAQPQSTSANYTLSDKPVSEADTNAATTVLVASLSCPDGDPDTNRLLWHYSTYTDDYFAGVYLTSSPAWMADQLTREKSELEPMSRLLAPLTPADYIVDSNDPAIQRHLISSPNLGTYAVMPDQFVAFADGRIGVPLLLAIPGGASAYSGYITTLMVPFVFFERVDGHWLLDTTTGVCPKDCSQAEARMDVYIDYYRKISTVIGSPVASPEATPES
ncbi:MAG: hypothetical protein QM753_02550 [Thermomicrobiales bacterium]